MKIVEQGSAVMNHPQELAFPLSETHESICKYSEPDNSSYKEIAGHVEALADAAIAESEAERERERFLENRLNMVPAAPST
jgi:hypothetical protein